MRISTSLILALILGASFPAHAVEPQPLFPVSLPSVPGNGLVALREAGGKTHFLPRMRFRVETGSAQLKVSFNIDDQGCADQLQRMKSQPERICVETTSKFNAATLKLLPREEYLKRFDTCFADIKEFMAQADLSCLPADGLTFSLAKYLKEPLKSPIPARGAWGAVTFPIDRRLVPDSFELTYDYQFAVGQTHPIFESVIGISVTR